MYNQNNNTPRPAQSFGSVQETFRYNLARGFNSGDQFTIVEDMPKNKPIRFETGEAQDKTGRKFESKKHLIRVVSRGYEADMVVYPKLLPGLAVLCPKGLENFKGATFVFDGINWAYMGIESTTQPPITSVSSAMRDPRQPDLNPTPPQADQKDVAVNKLAEKISEYNMLGIEITTKMVMTISEKLLPNDAVGLMGYAKSKGMISETEGKWKVN